MICLTDIQELYLQYLDAAIHAEQERRVTDGMFGIGKKASDDPCHTAFPEQLESMLHQFAAQKPDSEAVTGVLSYIYQIPVLHREPQSAFWMLIAVHGLSKELIPCLNKQDAAALCKEYCKTYRKWERLPVQKEVIRQLQAVSNS